MIINLLACSPPRPQFEEAALAEDSEEDWHDWMIYDEDDRRMAFLAGTDGQTSGGGIVVESVQYSPHYDTYIFNVPYNSFFAYIAVDEKVGEGYGIISGDAECALMADVNLVFGEDHQPRFAQFGSVSGLVSRIVVDSGTTLTAIGKCE